MKNLTLRDLLKKNVICDVEFVYSGFVARKFVNLLFIKKCRNEKSLYYWYHRR